MVRIQKASSALLSGKTAAALVFLVTIAASAYAAERSQVAATVQEGERNHVLRPVISENVEYYDIMGDCEKDLCDCLKENGCPWKDGRRYHSLTSWDFKWNYEKRKTANFCTTASFQPVVNISVRYPRWKKTGNPPAALEKKWEQFMKNLKTHENGHIALIVEAVSDVTIAVMKLPPQPNCMALDQEIEKIKDSRIRQLNDDTWKYDLKTRHGVEQGAVFP
ncbi:MAG TPA: DUF922 domain-containing protein [Nitrospirota bacterium]|nr:DUF922 domain-containing protein [Nitrospirota bacterium]